MKLINTEARQWAGSDTGKVLAITRYLTRRNHERVAVVIQRTPGALPVALTFAADSPRGRAVEQLAAKHAIPRDKPASFERSALTGHVEVLDITLEHGSYCDAVAWPKGYQEVQ